MPGFYVPYSSRCNKASLYSAIILLGALYIYLLFALLHGCLLHMSAGQQGRKRTKSMTSIGDCRLFFSAPQIQVLTMTSAAHGVCVWSKE